VFDDQYSGVESGDVVRFIINEGVVVGSTNIATPAFDVGSWPVGVTFILEINGSLEGKGGQGGAGGNKLAGSGAGSVGLSGGLALYTRRAINLEGLGTLGGGGGGGGGGGAPYAGYGAGGGGGGRGRQGGPGGLGGGGTVLPGTAGSLGTATAPGPGGSGNGISGDGGLGGDLGSSGSSGSGPSAAAGGSPGNAIDGDSYVTETGSVTIFGARVN
jgi:hypothetical protein